MKAFTKQKRPPLHLWHPDFCGDIDIRIDRTGNWYYMGTLINRERMVKLFSTILRREGDDFFLVTPVEKVGIRVDDAPFTAVEMDIAQGSIIFRTNLDDYVKVDDSHPITVSINDKTGEPSPYVRVRDNLDALISRSVYYQLAEIAVEHNGRYGVWSCGSFFPLDGQTL
ncbi:MAG: DUF1285 domain-containing protein [Kordiimonadaceae bacterium]|nr:DUF1285 domain-containing protein [Kordiimonadaceae bacterium]